MTGEDYLGPGWLRPAHERIASKLTGPQWRLLHAIGAEGGSTALPFHVATMAALLRHELVVERGGTAALTDLGSDVLAEADTRAAPFTPD